VTGDGNWIGSFDAHRLADPLASLGYLAPQNLKSMSVATGAALDRERMALFVALMARLEALVQARCSSGWWPGRSTRNWDSEKAAAPFHLTGGPPCRQLGELNSRAYGTQGNVERGGNRA